MFVLHPGPIIVSQWGYVLQKDGVWEENKSKLLHVFVFFWSEAKTWWGPSNGGVFNPLPHQIGLTGKELWFVSSVWNAMKKEGKERTEEETFPIWESCPREGGATKPSSSSSYYFYFNCVLIYHPLHMYLFFNHNSLTYIELDASTHKKYSNIGSLLVLVGRAQFLETHLKEKEILKLGRAN